jgi:hypothetical protein
VAWLYIGMITAQHLTSLGFVPLPGRLGRYSYKGFVGKLLGSGVYTFLGFNSPITTLSDLKYMLMLIDYQQESSFSGYPSSDN